MILWVRVETVAKYDAGDGDFRLKRRFEKLSGEPQIGTVSATTTGWSGFL